MEQYPECASIRQQSRHVTIPHNASPGTKRGTRNTVAREKEITCIRYLQLDCHSQLSSGKAALS